MRRVAFKEEFIYLASTHGETRCSSAGDVLEEEEDSKNSTDNRSDDSEDILEEGTEDDIQHTHEGLSKDQDDLY